MYIYVYSNIETYVFLDYIQNMFLYFWFSMTGKKLIKKEKDHYKIVIALKLV